MFNLTQIKGQFKSHTSIMSSGSIENPTHAVYAEHHHLFAELPDEYSYEAVLTDEEAVKLKEAGYEVIAY